MLGFYQFILLLIKHMTTEITSDIINGFATRLDNHPIYEAVESIEDLQCFMQHHIYSVWDFMSLIKYLQSVIVPTTYPWTPQGDASVRRFINELVLEEESDETHIDGEHSSHFELYHRAMTEVGADISVSRHFISVVKTTGIEAALQLPKIPTPSRDFTSKTFQFINAHKPHQVAAALALGREHIIPGMFRAILGKIGVTDEQAPIFHYYLNRHIHLDQDFHAPLSLRLLNGLCDGEEQKTQEAIDAASIAVNARLAFWDGVLVAINQQKARRKAS
ncbi:MAG: PROBABLE REMNANT OF A TRANSPOSASE GENE PROTEIN [uncultured Thiotrichaceae bacterium]|uniref:PROBABLE REMNANT OF A TRANSPOSASE GENE PROTEIN n=1 Tax=uncultured Thiotrichaceae bacterium TaxID=298394 RepID=A0A6S6TR11_9GAMM|nr:MAG: PROBABLE REMNANT OF A TRANSPOSASE GENE PROTEIN [uncultured Thiotrichaceae bacterium]